MYVIVFEYKIICLKVKYIVTIQVQSLVLHTETIATFIHSLPRSILITAISSLIPMKVAMMSKANDAMDTFLCGNPI